MNRITFLVALMTMQSSGLTASELSKLCDYSSELVQNYAEKDVSGSSYGGKRAVISAAVDKIRTLSHKTLGFYVFDLNSKELNFSACQSRKCNIDDFIDTMQVCAREGGKNCRILALQTEQCVIQMYYPSLDE